MYEPGYSENNNQFIASLAAFERELCDGLQRLKKNKDDIINLFNNWKNNRDDVIMKLTEISKHLHINHRKNNTTQVATTSVSLIGGIGSIFGLLATSALSAPLFAVGGIVAAAGGISSLTASILNQRNVNKLVKEADSLLNHDKDMLLFLLKEIDCYIERVQILDKKMLEEKDLRDFVKITKGLVSSSAMMIRYRTLMKSIKDLNFILKAALRPLSIYQKVSTMIKSSRVYSFFFGAGAARAAANIGAKAVGKRIFLFVGIAIDTVVLVSASSELANNEKPREVLQFEDTIKSLKMEKESVCLSLNSAFYN